MRKKLPASQGDCKTFFQIGLIAFGLGIFVAFFLTAKILAIIEAFLLIVAGWSFFRGN